MPEAVAQFKLRLRLSQNCGENHLCDCFAVFTPEEWHVYSPRTRKTRGTPLGLRCLCGPELFNIGGRNIDAFPRVSVTRTSHSFRSARPFYRSRSINMSLLRSEDSFQAQSTRRARHYSLANTSRKNSTALGSPDSPNDLIACFRTS